MSLNPATHDHTNPVSQTIPPKSNGAVRPIDELNEQGRRVQELVDQVDAVADPATRALLQDCLQSVLALHGQGLAQVLQVVQDSGYEGQKVFDRLIHDSVVRRLLLIHGLHPVNLEARLLEALDKVRPYMESHGGNVELISLVNDKACLRLQGTCKSCPSSAITLELAVRHAIEEACPDLIGFEVEGAVEPTTLDQTSSDAKFQPASWTLLEDLAQLNNDNLRVIETKGISLLICKVNENLYAYRNLCPACGLAFKSDGLEEGQLKCPIGHRYDAQRAGAGVHNLDLHLDPFPLLVENGRVKVSLR
ncbi:NifU family protein [Pedosphaera parvula]|uniref:Nitrogen-fixing NifU domain protein n=1 Tax=Pedosphaera parvula (strain Ellin514) TaxID=320771 RepID=B9XAS6_PEDPL|nr:NifU family protein [Pedosphaera parvula]EEF63111.1 nitrogen-fixing NifU domain protein [Pedosphaera parvula Ellin514]